MDAVQFDTMNSRPDTSTLGPRWLFDQPHSCGHAAGCREAASIRCLWWSAAVTESQQESNSASSEGGFVTGRPVQWRRQDTTTVCQQFFGCMLTTLTDYIGCMLTKLAAYWIHWLHAGYIGCILTTLAACWLTHEDPVGWVEEIRREICRSLRTRADRCR